MTSIVTSAENTTSGICKFHVDFSGGDVVEVHIVANMGVAKLGNSLYQVDWESMFCLVDSTLMFVLGSMFRTDLPQLA